MGLANRVTRVERGVREALADAAAAAPCGPGVSRTLRGAVVVSPERARSTYRPFAPTLRTPTTIRVSPGWIWSGQHGWHWDPVNNPMTDLDYDATAGDYSGMALMTGVDYGLFMVVDWIPTLNYRHTLAATTQIADAQQLTIHTHLDGGTYYPVGAGWELIAIFRWSGSAITTMRRELWSHIKMPARYSYSPSPAWEQVRVGWEVTT